MIFSKVISKSVLGPDEIVIKNSMHDWGNMISQLCLREL